MSSSWGPLPGRPPPLVPFSLSLSLFPCLPRVRPGTAVLGLSPAPDGRVPPPPLDHVSSAIRPLPALFSVVHPCRRPPSPLPLSRRHRLKGSVTAPHLFFLSTPLASASNPPTSLFGHLQAPKTLLPRCNRPETPQPPLLPAIATTARYFSFSARFGSSLTSLLPSPICMNLTGMPPPWNVIAPPLLNHLVMTDFLGEPHRFPACPACPPPLDGPYAVDASASNSPTSRRRPRHCDGPARPAPVVAWAGVVAL
jgi:hypothetical protein